MWRFFQGISRSLRTRTPAPSSQTAPRTDDNDSSANVAVVPCLTVDLTQTDCKEITQRILGQPSEADILLREFFGPNWKSRSQNKNGNSSGGHSYVISDLEICVGLGSLWVAALAVGRALFTSMRRQDRKQKTYADVISCQDYGDRLSEVLSSLARKDNIQFYPPNCYIKRRKFWKHRLSILPHSISKPTVLAAGGRVNIKTHQTIDSKVEHQFHPTETVLKIQPNKKCVTFENDVSGEPTSSMEENEFSDSISDEVIEQFTESAKGCSGATYDILGLQSVRSENYREAFHRFQLGAKEGYPKALFNVGLCYEQGLGTKKDIAKAIEAYEKAAYKGHAKAQYNLALILLKTEDIASKAHALNLLEKAAMSGLVQAQSYLGFYLANRSDFQNMEKAVKMFKLAAEQGDVISKHHLAICYERGLGGLKQDLIRAFDLYSSAASAGHLDAKYQMAVMLNAGFEDLEKNPKVAQELLASAAESGHRPSAKLLKELRPTQQNRKMGKIRDGPGITERDKGTDLLKDHSLLTRHTVFGMDKSPSVLQMECKSNGIHSEFVVGMLTKRLMDAKLVDDILAPQISFGHSHGRARSYLDDKVPTKLHADVANTLRLPRSSTTPNLYYHSPMVKDRDNSVSLEV